jgi:hypothetical protein|tara:strand:+ start:108 stop:287 length:180 start_codon:yes stop_codon:yes gene_type:complete
MTIWKSKIPDDKSVVQVPIEDMKIILRQLWKSRSTEPDVGKIYEKYKDLDNFQESFINF